MISKDLILSQIMEFTVVNLSTRPAPIIHFQKIVEINGSKTEIDQRIQISYLGEDIWQ